MKKLRLNLERLEVQSFETEHAAGERGTVQGRAGTYREWTCDGTCDQTCGAPASCVGAGEYCGTYPDQGCPNSQWYCTDAQWVC